jgi:23S rRNA pseudouridine2605 synthase
MNEGIGDCLIDRAALLPGAAMDDKSKFDQGGERVAKVIARAGLASRREAEQWIAAGRVAVNGAVIHSPALNVDGSDQVAVDGEPLPARERTRLFLYNKPRGLLTARNDAQGRPTIFQRLPKGLPRLISVGRLDFNTEGLILLTNDGALARVLELPATGWLRRYRVRAHGSVNQPQLDALRAGITIGGIHYGPIDATLERVQASNLWLTFAIREGKNREVRNVLGQLGLTVARLIRVSFGPFQLADLGEGAVEEVRTRTLREQLGERVIALAGANFSAAIGTPRPRTLDAKTPPDAQPHRLAGKSKHHVWRAHEEERPAKKLRRKFHGARGDRKPAGEPLRESQTSLLTDRKGRDVLVERHGEPPCPKPPDEWRPPRSNGDRPHKRGRRGPDRVSGARPRRPYGPR